MRYSSNLPSPRPARLSIDRFQLLFLLVVLLTTTTTSQVRADDPKQPDPVPSAPKPEPTTANPGPAPSAPKPEPTATKPESPPAAPKPEPTTAKPEPPPATPKPEPTTARTEPPPATPKPESTAAKPEPERAPTMPTLLDICLTSTIIAPTKEDGSPWDAGGVTVKDAEKKVLFQAFNEAMKIPAARQVALATAVAAILGSKALPLFAKPDVFGTVDLAPTGSYGAKNVKHLALASRKKPQSEFHAKFQPTPCFKGVTWSKQLRLRVSLTDKDLLEDDPIGVVEINSADVSAAYAYGKAFLVPVSTQAPGIKYVVLIVTDGANDDD